MWQVLSVPFWGSGALFSGFAVGVFYRQPLPRERAIDKCNTALFLMALGLFFLVFAAWMWHW